MFNSISKSNKCCMHLVFGSGTNDQGHFREGQSQSKTYIVLWQAMHASSEHDAPLSCISTTVYASHSMPLVEKSSFLEVLCLWGFCWQTTMGNTSQTSLHKHKPGVGCRTRHFVGISLVAAYMDRPIDAVSSIALVLGILKHTFPTLQHSLPILQHSLPTLQDRTLTSNTKTPYLYIDVLEIMIFSSATACSGPWSLTFMATSSSVRTSPAYSQKSNKTAVLRP